MKNIFTSPARHPAFCMVILFFGCFLFSSFLSISTAQAQLQGSYTIGGIDGDYTSFTDAAQALESEGTSGPVTFRIRPGVYHEQLHLSQPYEHLTFEGESSDSTKVVLKNEGGHAVLIEGGWDYTFRGMTLSGSESAVHILQGKEYGTSDILLESNILKGGEEHAVIETYTEGRGFPHHNHTYRNNLIIGEGTGISKRRDTHVDWFTGGRLTDDGLEISGNIIQVENIGIHLYAQEQVKINANQISVGKKDDSNFAQGISLSYIFRLNELNQNEVRVRGTGATGLIVSGAHMPEKMLQNRVLLADGGTGIIFGANFENWVRPSLVANNMISVKGNRGSIGLLIDNTHGTPAFYHNSVLVYGEDANSKALSLLQGYTLYKAELLNNVFANKAGGYAVHVEVEDSEAHGITPVSNSDYNVLYSSGQLLAHVEGQNLAGISQWQSLTGFDTHSLSVDPQFASEENLIPTNTALAGAGIFIEEVSTDFYSIPRNAPPTIGAVEIEADKPTDPEALIPFVECVVRNRDGSYTATFGYENPNAQAVSLAIGAENRLNLLEYAGQPHSFAPGRHERAFHVVFEGSTPLSWTLGSQTISVDLSSAPCENPVQPVEPLASCVSELSRTIYMAQMGYNNPNAEPVAIIPGRLNRMHGQQEQGQPTVFEPGQHPEVFHATFTGALMWTLGSERVMANTRTQSCSPALQAVQPFLDCVSRNEDGSYTAHFGYHNPNPVAVIAGMKHHNLVIPARAGGEELPDVFEPGRHERVFSVPFRGQRLEWRLMGLVVRATPASTGACEGVNARMASEAFSDEAIRQLPVYPNPFSRVLQIQLPVVGEGPVDLKVYSLTGVLLKAVREEQGGNQQLDLEALGAGSYILEIQAGEIHQRIRIVKQ